MTEKWNDYGPEDAANAARESVRAYERYLTKKFAKKRRQARFATFVSILLIIVLFLILAVLVIYPFWKIFHLY